ncbi:MAG TPA: prolyl oligopeptidase family serine peptidase [Pyrinomonadaceae bacterium]|nr:prolyl oligopeptidase family serine peptidase [Pyrinomonadaceae bacterium]
MSAGCGVRAPQYSDAEYSVRSVDVGGETYGYRVYVPSHRSPGEKLPVMLYLHGSNRRGTDNQDQISDLAENIAKYPERFSFIIVFPQCRENTFWAGPMRDMAMAALDQTVQEFGGDPDRLYIAGYSMGGFGVWQTAVTYPNKFAAAVAVAGGVEAVGVVNPDDARLLSPQATAAATNTDPFKAYAEALRHLPIWLVHGETDSAISPEQSRKLAAAFRVAGDADVNYRELPGVGHGSIAQAFSDPNLFPWLERQRRGTK